MTSIALVTGTIHRAPQEKAGKSGPYGYAIVRSKDAEATFFWGVLAFNDAARIELLRLEEGDAVSVQGALRASIYTPAEAPPRLSLSLMAEKVVGARLQDVEPAQIRSARLARKGTKKRRAPKKKPATEPSQRAASDPAQASLIEPSLNDEVPW